MLLDLGIGPLETPQLVFSGLTMVGITAVDNDGQNVPVLVT